MSRQLIFSRDVKIRTGRPLVPERSDAREDERKVVC